MSRAIWLEKIVDSAIEMRNALMVAYSDAQATEMGLRWLQDNLKYNGGATEATEMYVDAVRAEYYATLVQDWDVA